MGESVLNVSFMVSSTTAIPKLKAIALMMLGTPAGSQSLLISTGTWLTASRAPPPKKKPQPGP